MAEIKETYEKIKDLDKDNLFIISVATQALLLRQQMLEVKEASCGIPKTKNV